MTTPSAPTTAPPPGRNALLGMLLCCALVGVFCAPLLRGRSPYVADAGQVFYPMMFHVAEGLRAHGTPAPWNAALAGGYFAHGAGQSGMAYPLHWIVYRLAPMPQAYGYSYAVHVLLACVGFHVLLRRHGLHPLAVVLGAALYAFSGHVAGHHIHYNVLPVLAWLPWALAALQRALERPGMVGLFGLVFGLMALGGHPQWLWLSGLIAALYAMLCPTASPVRLRRRLGTVALGLVLGGLVAGVQLLPTAQTARSFHRGGADLMGFATSFALRLADVPRLLCPGLHGNPLRGDCLLDGPQWWETAGFQGAVALSLAAFSLAAYRWGRSRWLAAALIAAGLALAFARGNPLYWALVHVPVVGSFRAPARYLLLALVGIALAAAEGLDAILRGRDVDRPRLAAWAGVGVPALAGLLVVMGNLVFAGFTWALSSPLDPQRLLVPVRVRADVLHNYFVGWEPIIILLGAVGAALVVLCRRSRYRVPVAAVAAVLAVAELGAFWRSFVVTAPPSYYATPPQCLARARELSGRDWARLLIVQPPTGSSRQDVERAAAMEFLAPSWGLPVLQGMDTLQPWEGVLVRHRTAAALAAGDGRSAARGARLCRLFGIRWVVSSSTLTGPTLRPVAGEPYLYEVPSPLPFAYVATNVLPAPALEDQHAVVERASFRPGVDCATAPLPGASSPQPSGTSAPTCTILTREPGRVRARVVAPSGGVLVVQQDWHSGWRATIDGAPAPCQRANAINLAVPLPAGARAHEVELRFTSRATQIGAGVSLVGIVLCVALLLGKRATAAVPRGGAA